MARTPNANGFEIPLLVSLRSLPRIHSLGFHCSSNPSSRQNSTQCSNQFYRLMASECLDNNRLWVNTNFYNVVLVRLVGWDTADTCFWLLRWMICLSIVFPSLILSRNPSCLVLIGWKWNMVRWFSSFHNTTSPEDCVRMSLLTGPIRLPSVIKFVLFIDEHFCLPL